MKFSELEPGQYFRTHPDGVVFVKNSGGTYSYALGDKTFEAAPDMFTIFNGITPTDSLKQHQIGDMRYIRIIDPPPPVDLSLLSKRPQDLCEYLNAALELDPVAIDTLFSFAAPCNEAIAEHPHIQVREIAGANLLRFIGLLNGLIADSGKLLCEVRDDQTGKLLRFELKEKNNAS